MQVLNVVRKVKIDGKWRFLPVSKAKVGFDWKSLDLHGLTMVSTQGTFYLDYRENGKRVRRAIGDHPRLAKAALASQTSILQLRGSGVKLGDDAKIKAYRPISGVRISEIVEQFVINPPLKLRKRS